MYQRRNLSFPMKGQGNHLTVNCRSQQDSELCEEAEKSDESEPEEPEDSHISGEEPEESYEGESVEPTEGSELFGEPEPRKSQMNCMAVNWRSRGARRFSTFRGTGGFVCRRI